MGTRERKRESVWESIRTFRRVERSFTRRGNIVRRVARLPRSWLSFRTAAGTSRGSPETRSGVQSDLHGRLHNVATKEKDWGGSKRRPKAKLLLCQDCGRLEPPRQQHRPRRLRSAVRWRWFARVNALCNLSRKTSREVAASLPGRFLCRRCFRLCITMEVEPRIAKKYKCHHCYSCKN